MADNVNHPSHYETGKFECIDVMVETQGIEATQAFCACNAFKYLYRHNKKNGIEDIQKTYLSMGFSNFKIEGRGLGSAIILEFLLYYMTKPEHQLEVRESVYLDSMLDLF